MKNKRRKGVVLAAVVLSMLSTAPVHANVGSMDVMDVFPEAPGSVSYVIDFFDQDGNILDSRICTYGERLEDIITPGDREEGGCVYRFTGWEPELSEVVTDSVAYMAVYERVGETGDSAENVVSGAEIKEQEESITQTTSDDTSLDAVDRVSSTSYDVTTFHIETPTEIPKEPEEQTDVSAEETLDISIPETDVSEDSPRTDRITRPEPGENERLTEQAAVGLPGSWGGFEDIEIPAVDLSGISDLPAVSVGVIPEGGESVAEPKQEIEEIEVPSVKKVGKPSRSRNAAQDGEKVGDVSPKSFPLPQFLCVAALVGGAAWLGKRRAY